MFSAKALVAKGTRLAVEFSQVHYPLTTKWLHHLVCHKTPGLVKHHTKKTKSLTFLISTLPKRDR